MVQMARAVLFLTHGDHTVRTDSELGEDDSVMNPKRPECDRSEHTNTPWILNEAIMSLMRFSSSSRLAGA